jgi:homoserine kinase type II
MSTRRRMIDQAALAQVVRRYPQLGLFTGISRNGLSVSTAACLFETEHGTYFAKRYDPHVRSEAALGAEHAITKRLLEAGFPTPNLHANNRGDTLTWLAEQPYAIYDLARGEDRYGEVPVFAPYHTNEEVRSAGAMMARFHRLLMGMERPPTRPFAGLTAQFKAWEAPTLAEGLAPLIHENPDLAEFLARHEGWGQVLQLLAARHPAIHAALPALPRGILHGDWIKRNLFFQGSEVSDVVDFELWNSGVLIYDIALALLPIAFNWPEILGAGGQPNGPALKAFLEGYASVRALEPAEREALPLVMEGARLEFYLSGIAASIAINDQHQAALFWEILSGTVRYFEAHPRWRELLN